MALPEQQNGAALHFALNRLMQAQQAGLLGLGGNSAQFSHDPRQLLAQYHQFSPMIAQQVHQGASLNAPTPQPLAAPGAPQPPSAPGQARPLAASGGGAGGGAQQQQIKVNVTLPGHAHGAAQNLFQTLMGMGRY